MKITLVGNFDYFGQVSNWVANCWEYNGHEVTRLDRKQLSPDSKFDSDILFLMDVSEDYSNRIPRLDIPIVFWSYDSNMPLGLQRSVNIARKSDLVFTMNHDEGRVKLAKFGIDAIWTPSGLDNTLLDLPYTKMDVDVCMIGNPNSQARVDLWNMLNANFKAKAGPVKSQQEYVDYMRSCKIVVNQPTEPYDNITNTRPFEGMAFGKLVLTKRITIADWRLLGGISGENMVFWNDFDHLKDLIQYYLDKPKEANKIAKKGRVLGLKCSIAEQLKIMEQYIKRLL